MMSRPLKLTLACLLLSLLCVGCTTRTRNLASSRAMRDAGLDASIDEPVDGDADVLGPPLEIDAGVVYCGALPCACSNGLDDDGDQLVDALDPECTGPSDRLEDSLAIGVHGEAQGTKCQDCFFDENSGAGDDGCNRPRSCTADPSAISTGACTSCAVGAACVRACAPRAPNGCDCFGCCGVWRDGVAVNVLLRATCTVDALDDSALCPRCVPARDCFNPCGPCELCTGRTVSDLPAICANGGGPGFSCDEGAVCVDGRDCGAAQFCQQGCCVDLAI